MNINIWNCELDRIRRLGPNDLNGKLGNHELLRFMAAWGAYFECRSPSEPHLAWGSPVVHYRRFVHTAALLEYPHVAGVVADQLVKRLPEDPPRPDCVAGPSHGAWGLVGALAQRYGGIRQQLTKRDNVRKEQTWQGSLLALGSIVQLCDDLVRGGETLQELALAVLAASLNLKGVGIRDEVMSLVNVSGKDAVGISINGEGRSFHVTSLVSFKEERWLPQDCPLCKQGSPVVNEIKPYLYEKPAEGA